MSTVTKPIMLDETGERIADALESMAENTVTMTITATATDSVSCAGQTIKVMDVASGIKFTEFVYSGQPQSVTIPKGMSYNVIPVVTLAEHYCDDVASGIAMTNVAVSLSYKSIASITTFPAMKAAVEAGLASRIPIGKTISFTHASEGVLEYEMVNYNPIDDSLEFLQKTTLNQQKQFDAPEALYKPTTQMSAGAYSFVNGSTTYYFTLTVNVPANGHVRATTSAFQTYQDAYHTEPLESGAVSTTAIAGATSIGTVGQGVLNHMDRVNYGSNDYGESNLSAWLCASGDGDAWWTPKTMFDRPPSYVSDDGFLKGVPQNVLDSVDTSSIVTGVNTTYVAPDSTHTKGSTYTMQAKFYLPTQNNLFGQSDIADGTRRYGAYIGASDSARIHRYGTSARTWWLRSPHAGSGLVRGVYSSGSSNFDTVNDSCGVVPACKISKSAI